MGFKILEKNKIIIGLAVFSCLIMVIFPEVTAEASKEAISLWLNSVVPSLLPFFIASNFLKRTGFAEKISPDIYPFLAGFLSGYPMGAKISGDYFRRGLISGEHLRKVLSYSMITGPAFLLGAVGVGFLGSYKLGVILLASHYIGAFANSVFYGVRDTVTGKAPKGKERRRDSYYNLFTDAILDSFRAIAIILAYLIIFMIVIDLLQFSGILAFAKTAESVAFIKGFFEMTLGCSSLTASFASDRVKVCIATFTVSFGGLSVLGQSMSMLRGCGVSFGELFLMKLSHGIISGLLAFSIGCFVL